MDLASLIGLALCFVLVIFGITVEDGFGVLKNFVDVPSILITFGGAFCATLASHKIPDFITGLKGFTIAIKQHNYEQTETIKKIIELSNVARKEGLLALEEASAELDDAFLRKGVLLIVDGTDPELVRGILETEMSSIDDRHKKNISFWTDLGGFGPAWGMIGTLIGLVNMLKQLSDPDSIGPQMAVALLTTLYGSLIANWMCIPLAYKLKANDALETMMREITIEGLLSIQAGENPRVIEEKLKSFLAPAARAALGSDDAGGEM